MNEKNTVSFTEIYCPFCGKTHSLEKRERISQAIVKDEVVDYEETYILCPLSDDEENEFVPAGIMDENLLRARNSYRKKKSLLTSDEIMGIRNSYGLTQSEFSALLGWGEVTVTRYETKTIQDETYDCMMRMVSDNPVFAMECLDRHRDKFSPEKYAKIRAVIAEKSEKTGTAFFKKKEIISLYINFNTESDLNGYKLLDIEKLENVMAYFARFVDNLYKVKLMKLLWYADAIFFGRYGKSLTGLVYRHMPLGSLPIAYNEIIYLPAVKVEEEIINDEICYRIMPDKEVNISAFSLEELDVLNSVAAFFRNYKTNEIIDYMHNEKAYKETMPNRIIPYSLAKQLKDWNSDTV